MLNVIHLYRHQWLYRFIGTELLTSTVPRGSYNQDSIWFFTISEARTQETTQWRSHKRPKRNKNNTTKLNKESLWWAKPLIKIKIAWRFFFCTLRKCSLRISNSPKGHKKGVKSTWANLCTFLSELFPYVFSRKKFFLEVKTSNRSCPFFENLGKYGTGQSRGKTCVSFSLFCWKYCM